MARFILETDHLSRQIIRHTDNPSKYKSEDEFWRIICLDINRSRVSRRVSRCWAEWKPGESLNMAALVALLMKSRRTALDMAVYQRRISSVKRMFEPENSLMNFMLPFSLANLAQDRKTRSRDEIRNKKWWEDGLQNWSEWLLSRARLLYRTPSWNRHPRKPCKTIETSLSHMETSSKTVFVFRLDKNLETDDPSKTSYPSVSTSWRRADRRISLRRILLHNSS